MISLNSSDMGRRLMRSSLGGNSGGGGTLPRGLKSPLMNSSSTLEEEMNFDLNDDRDTNNYIVLLDAFILLLQRDRDLLNCVFPTDLQTIVFAKLIELPLEYMREEGQHLCEKIDRLPRKLDQGKFAIFGVFSILRWFLKSRSVFAKLFQVNQLLLNSNIYIFFYLEIFKESDVTRRQQFTTLSATFERAVKQIISY